MYAVTDWKTLDQQYIMSTYGRLPLTISKGEGNYIYDEDGKAYLDLFTGLAVNIMGHSHPSILATIREQSAKFLHISNLFLNKPAIQLAQSLVQHSISGKVFFTNSGAEATESMIKLVHKWIVSGKGEGKEGFVALKNSFHGRTLGALSLSRQPGAYQDFPSPSFKQAIYEVEPENIEELRNVFAKHAPAVVIIEPILGSGGIFKLSDAYLDEIQRLCSQHGTLLCLDEIQSGVGRTGKFFAYQHTNLQPDLILFAKGIGGGLPLGGVIAHENIADLFKPGDHGTTFAPSPLSASLGNTVIDELFNKSLLEQGREHADYLMEKLLTLSKQSSFIGDIRGKGMMIGIDTKGTPEQVSELQKRMLQNGVLMDITQKTVIRLLPPLTLTKKDIDFFIDELEKQIKNVQ